MEPVFQKKTQEAEHWNHRLGKVARSVFNLDFTSLLVEWIWVEGWRQKPYTTEILTNPYLTQNLPQIWKQTPPFSRSLIPIHLEIIIDNSMTTFHTDTPLFIQLMVANQLRLVVYPIVYTGFIHPNGASLGFLNHQQSQEKVTEEYGPHWTASVTWIRFNPGNGNNLWPFFLGVNT